MDLATLLRSAPPQKNINGKKLKKRGKLYQPRGDKLTLFHTAQAREMIPIKRNENCCRSDNWAMRIGYLSCFSHLCPMHLVKGCEVLLDLISDFFFCRFAFRHWCPEYGPGPTGDERRGRERDLEGGWEGGGWATYIGASRATGGRGAPALSPSLHLSMCNCSWSWLSRSSS